MSLGQVHEREIERERTDHRLGRAEVEIVQVPIEPFPLAWIVVGAQGDRPPTNPLDQREELRTSLLRDDLAEEGAQQADLGGERVSCARRADPGRFRLDRDRSLRPGHARTRAEPFRAPAITAPQPFWTATFRRLVW